MPFIHCFNLFFIFFFFLMIRRPPRSTLILHSFPTRRSSDLRDGRRRPHHRRRHGAPHRRRRRSEEHTSELQSHSEISYAVFCLKKKKTHKEKNHLYKLNVATNIKNKQEKKKTNYLKCKYIFIVNNKETLHRMFIVLFNTSRNLA